MAQALSQAASSARSVVSGRSTVVGGDDSALRLEVVPARRRAAGLLAAFFVVVALMLLGAAALHTQLAERQYELDRFERSLRTAQTQFDDFRRQRAELRAPNRLGDEARRLGLAPARDTEFIDADPWVVAQVIAATGQVPSGGADIFAVHPLDQLRAVKAVSAEMP